MNDKSCTYDITVVMCFKDTSFLTGVHMHVDYHKMCR